MMRVLIVRLRSNIAMINHVSPQAKRAAANGRMMVAASAAPPTAAFASRKPMVEDQDIQSTYFKRMRSAATLTRNMSESQKDI
ncbi:hypothetical protein [Hyphomicrobium sp. MC8b]|uniref:hypothetical protein n=1 Tax=Hyphomicrobium sp. MC8b TaxID=300273 RepID=UPI00391959CA